MSDFHAKEKPNTSMASQLESLQCLNKVKAWLRCCVITIENDTKYDLISGLSATTSGVLHREAPATIKSRDYGVILARKTSYSHRGAVGMISYEIKNVELESRYLQVGWHVPWDMNLQFVYFNINLGKKPASRDETYELLYPIKPENRRRASDSFTPYEASGMKFEAAMSDAQHSMLTIRITESTKSCGDS